MNLLRAGLSGVALLVAAVAVALTAGCGRQERATSDVGPSATVSILPQACFVERIAGDRVRVNVMVEPGQSPETYEPRPAHLTALRGAGAYFALGVPFESAWRPRILAVHPDIRWVDTGAGIDRIPLPGEHDHHGHAHDHEDGLDPHIWLSPRLVARQADTICETLCELFPEHAPDFRANLAAFHEDIEALDRELRVALEELPQRTFMAFHPSWGYFARDYDLEMLVIERAGQEPSAAELAALIEQARGARVGVILAEPEFNTTAAETIAKQTGARVLRVSPLAEDWFGNLRALGRALADGLQEKTP